MLKEKKYLTPYNSSYTQIYLKISNNSKIIISM